LLKAIQTQQSDQTNMEDPTEATQPHKTPNDMLQLENTTNLQSGNEDISNDAKTNDTDQTNNTHKEMETAKKTKKELDKQDWFQQIQQEEEGASSMMVDETTPEQYTQKNIVPARGNWKTNGESATVTKEENDTSKPKKLKLGTGNERRTANQADDNSMGKSNPYKKEGIGKREEPTLECKRNRTRAAQQKER